MRRLTAILVGLVLFGAAIGALAQEKQAAPAQDTQPSSTRKIVSRATPAYPELARKLNLRGIVKLMVTVTPNGSVKSVQTIGGNPVLVRAAEDSIQKFKWSPAQQESKELVEIEFSR